MEYEEDNYIDVLDFNNKNSISYKWQSEKCKKSSYRKVVKYKNNLYCDIIEECGEYW